MKSLDKKKTKELEWEKNWVEMIRLNLNNGNYGDTETMLKVKSMGIIFISSLLQKKRTELLEEILKAVDKLEKSNGDVPSPELRATVSYLLNKKDE